MNKLINNWSKTFDQFQADKQLSDSTQYLILAVILLGVLLIRILTIKIPSLDWTAWKEIDYLYISQNYLRNGFNFFRPEVSWPAELPHITEMEFPLVPYIAAVLYKLFGYGAYTARSITAFAFILMVIYVFKLAKRELGEIVGLTAALTAAIIPLYQPFGRFLFTEPLMIAMSVVSLYYTAEWEEHERKRDWILAVVSISLTFALKLESLYLLLPLGWIAFRKHKFHIQKYKGFISLVLFSMILPILWYSYAYYLEGIGAHLFGIFSGHNKSQTVVMLTDFRWYRTMAGRVINGILGGFIGFAFFLAGLLGALIFRKGGLFLIYLISVFIYFALVAEGQIDAPYRQMTLIPVASVFVGLGIQFIVITIVTSINSVNISLERKYSHKIYLVLGCLVLVFLMLTKKYSYIIDQDGPVHWDRWQAAEEILKFTNEKSKLITVGEYSKHVGGYDLSPVLYYYTSLQGWTLTPEAWQLERIQELREKGATFLVALLPYGYPYDFIYLPEESNEIFLQQVRSTYPLLYEDQNQLVFDLR